MNEQRLKEIREVLGNIRNPSMQTLMLVGFVGELLTMIESMQDKLKAAEAKIECISDYADQLEASTGDIGSVKTAIVIGRALKALTDHE